MSFRPKFLILLGLIPALNVLAMDGPNKPAEGARKVELIRAVIFGHGIDVNIDGIGNRMAYFRSKYSDRHKNHVFLDPFNKDKDKINSADAVIHEIEKDDLKSAIVKIFNEYDPERMVIFLVGHGMANGDFCYAGHLQGDEMAQICADLDQGNRQKEASMRLKKLLIVPLSCHNKIFANKMLAALKQGPPKSFSIDITHMAWDGPEKHLLGTSAGETLFKGSLHVIEWSDSQFKNWINSEDRLNRLYNTTKLDQLVNLINEAMDNNTELSYKQHSVISRFSADEYEAQIDLAEFELDLDKIILSRFESTAPQQLAEQQYFSPKTLLKHLINVEKIEDLVLSVTHNNSVFLRDSQQYAAEKIWESCDCTIDISAPKPHQNAELDGVYYARLRRTLEVADFKEEAPGRLMNIRNAKLQMDTKAMRLLLEILRHDASAQRLLAGILNFPELRLHLLKLAQSKQHDWSRFNNYPFVEDEKYSCLLWALNMCLELIGEHSDPATLGWYSPVVKALDHEYQACLQTSFDEDLLAYLSCALLSFDKESFSAVLYSDPTLLLMLSKLSGDQIVQTQKIIGLFGAIDEELNRLKADIEATLLTL